MLHFGKEPVLSPLLQGEYVHNSNHSKKNRQRRTHALPVNRKRLMNYACCTAVNFHAFGPTGRVNVQNSSNCTGCESLPTDDVAALLIDSVIEQIG